MSMISVDYVISLRVMGSSLFGLLTAFQLSCFIRVTVSLFPKKSSFVFCMLHEIFEVVFRTTAHKQHESKFIRSISISTQEWFAQQAHGSLTQMICI